MKVASGEWQIGCLLAVIFCAGCGRPTTERAQNQFFGRFETFGSFGTGAGQFNKPRSVAVDGAGNVFVVDMTGRVQRFDESGPYLGAWQAPETTLGRPKGMGVDADGHLMLVEPHYQRITHFNAAGKPIRIWGKRGIAPGELEFPRAVAADAAGHLFVCEYLQVQRIQKFDLQGHFLKAWGAEGSAPSEFRRPEGIGIDKDGNVYVADSCNHRVQKFTNDGVFLSEFGRPGIAPGELSYPYDVKVGKWGKIYVCEFGNSRIQVFSEQGVSEEIIGGSGAGEWQFRNPWGIALDREENLWVADSMNHRIVKLIRFRSTHAGSALPDESGR
ncbi:MAG: hypothetical protein HY360_10045 [Verrucomicrobia bacterium]|nr:hypothetical protein [Verrucomicrobiota bacterium]